MDSDNKELKNDSIENLHKPKDEKSLPPLIHKDEALVDKNFSDLNPDEIRLSSMSRGSSGSLPPLKVDMPVRKTTHTSKEDFYTKENYEFSKEIEGFKKFRKVKSEATKKAMGLSVCLILAAGVFYGLAYMSMNSEKQQHINDIENDIMTLGGDLSGLSDSQESKADGLMTLDEKNKNGLNPYLIDSDKDGLSDNYEINTIKTDPNKADSDGDNVTDGAEIYFKLNPLSDKTDGNTPDNDVTVENKINSDNAAASLSGTPEIYNTVFEKTDNISLNGALGLLGNAYEFYTDSVGYKAEIDFTYTDDMLNKWSTSEADLSVLKFDTETSSFVPVESYVDDSKKTVSTSVSENGIYALGNVNTSTAEYTAQVLFLIDNSGSMFPEAMCEGSEENDVDFKRVDFVVQMLDRFDDGTMFGAGKFTSSYTQLCGMTDDRNKVKSVVEGLKTTTEYFTGTEIVDSISDASSQFKTGNEYKNYIILLTDGMSSTIIEQKEAEARGLCNKLHITLITVGLGKQVDTAYLQSLASDTNGMYFNATNAEALEYIFDRIDSFTTYNHVEITDSEDVVSSVVIADSGFNIKDDGFYYNNYRSENSLGGTSFGISELVSKYYSGTLAEKQNGFKTADGTEVTGYDLSGSDLFADVRTNLNEWRSPVLDAYSNYTANENKWDFNDISDGCLYHNAETRGYINSNSLLAAKIDYRFAIEDKSKLKEILRAITFSDINNIETAECAAVSPLTSTGEDSQVLKAICYYQNVHLYGQCEHYDFGSDGDTAFNLMVKEISEGRPAVVSIGNKAVVGVRLLKVEDSANKYKLQIFDSDEPQREKYIEIKGTPVTDGGKSVRYQYTASYAANEQQFCLYITE